MSKSLKNSDVIYWKLYSRKLIPQTFQTAKFTKPQTNSTKRIHQKVSNCHSRFETSPKQLLYVPNCRSRFETFRKQTPPWFEHRRFSKVSENQQNQDLKIFPDSVFQMLPQCISQKTYFSHEFFKWMHSRIGLFKRMLSIHVNQTFGTSLPAKYSSYQPSINQQNIHNVQKYCLFVNYTLTSWAFANYCLDATFLSPKAHQTIWFKWFSYYSLLNLAS